MGTVFAFLTLLMLVMLGMRTLDRRSAGSVADAVDRPQPASGASSGVPQRKLPSWAVAAAVVYLDAERELERGSATVWANRRHR